MKICMYITCIFAWSQDNFGGGQRNFKLWINLLKLFIFSAFNDELLSHIKVNSNHTEINYSCRQIGACTVVIFMALSCFLLVLLTKTSATAIWRAPVREEVGHQNYSRFKQSAPLSIGNYDIQTDQPTDHPTDGYTWSYGSFSSKKSSILRVK